MEEGVGDYEGLEDGGSVQEEEAAAGMRVARAAGRRMRCGLGFRQEGCVAWW